MRRLATVLIAGLLLGIPATALRGAGDDLEEARRLTWNSASRQQGIEALRRLCAAEPDAVSPRLELGRVLTWNRDTRAEGLTILRSLAADHPGRADVTETLAEVLTWNEVTREEGIEGLRQVTADDPERTSAQILLAEVLSWSKLSRDEAEAIYREILRQHPDSHRARLGLAQLLSWRGERDASRDLYREALGHDPADAAARLGLADLQRSAGRSRAVLRTLPPGDDAGSDPDQRLRRGRAYADLERPALALAEFDAVLAVRPEDGGALEGAGRARLELRPTLEIGLQGSTESGSGATSRLESAALPVTLAWHPGRTDVRTHLVAAQSYFDNQRGTTSATSAGLGLEIPAGVWSRWSLEVMGHDFEEADNQITGRFEWRLQPVDAFVLSLGASRDFETSSRLTAAGEVIGGVLYGPVLSDEVSLGLSLRPGRWDYSVRGSLQSIEGDGILDNDREALFAGFGRAFTPGRAWLRIGYALAYLAYDRDLSGFPPAALSGNGIEVRGAGGYFSPFRFLNQMLRLDASWPAGPRLVFFGGGGVGRQQVEDTGNRDFDATTTSSDAYLGWRWRLSDGFSWRFRVSYQDVASAFDRTRAHLSLIWTF